LGKVIPLRRDGYKVEGEAVRIAMDKPHRRRWNWRRALGNLLTLAGIVAAGLFLAYLALGWVAGEPW